MKDFIILIDGKLHTKIDLQSSVKSIARFYHSLTPRHRRNVRVILLDDNQHSDLFLEMARHFKLTKSLAIFNRLNLQHRALAYQLADVFLSVAPIKNRSDITEAVKNQLVFIAGQGVNEERLLSASFTRFVPLLSREMMEQDFGKNLHMLYFDPQAMQRMKAATKNTIKTTSYFPISVPPNHSELLGPGL